ncbi:MAG: phosphatidylserine decarboxylase [Candidatus Zixiibacteriota bacterium]|nr:MAG: phosphatidylserine decarboxylase [candidate division Zixibacteria bacterium]
MPFLIISAFFMFLFSRHIDITFAYVATVFFFLGMAVMLFFRDPDRKIPEGENLILSPADGRVIKIEEINGYPALSIFLSIFDVHVNRAPVSGTVKYFKYHPGKFHSAFKDKAEKENQKNEIEIETSAGIVKMFQVAGSIARRTTFHHKIGDNLKAGQRIGLIRFGSRVDLVLPVGSKIDTRLRQRVKGGKTVLGMLP